MTPGYSLVQGSLSNLSGPYFLHATAKRSEIETISCQRSTWKSQTQHIYIDKGTRCREGLGLTHFQSKQFGKWISKVLWQYLDWDGCEMWSVNLDGKRDCLFVSKRTADFVEMNWLTWRWIDSSSAAESKEATGLFQLSKGTEQKTQQSNQVFRYIFTSQTGSFTHSQTDRHKWSLQMILFTALLRKKTSLTALQKQNRTFQINVTSVFESPEDTVAKGYLTAGLPKLRGATTDTLSLATWKGTPANPCIYSIWKHQFKPLNAEQRDAASSEIRDFHFKLICACLLPIGWRWLLFLRHDWGV